MIRSYQRVLMKCMSPAKTKNGPKSLLMRRILWTEDRLGFGDREALLVERPSDDHASEVVQLQIGQGAQIVQRADAPRIDPLPAGRPGRFPKRVQVGSLHQSVSIYGRIRQAADPALGQSRDHL